MKKKIYYLLLFLIPLILFFTGQETIKADTNNNQRLDRVKNGHSFTTWIMSFPNTNTIIASKPKWMAKKVTVRFHLNDTDNDNIYVETYTFNSGQQFFGMYLNNKKGVYDELTRNHYKMLGWSTDKDAHAAEYRTNFIVDNNWIDNNEGVMDLYAVWRGDTLWNGDHYYKDGVYLKGLQKIDNTWFLFDKKNGKYTGESGSNIYIGTFFNNNKTEKQQLFFTLNGKDFHIIETGDFYGRDMSVIYKNGTFYGTRTKGGDRDYAYFITSTNDFKKYTVTKASSLNLDILNYGGSIAPEWLVDYTGNNTGEYVYFCGKDRNDGNKWKIYRTKLIALPAVFETPQECIFFENPDLMQTADEKIDPSVIKVEDTYVMSVKRLSGEEYTEIYTSTDGLNWVSKQRIDEFEGGLLPYTVPVLYPDNKVLNKVNDIISETNLNIDGIYLTGKLSMIDTVTESEMIGDKECWVVSHPGKYFVANIGWEGAALSYINGMYYLYADHYIYTRINGYEAFDDDNGTLNGMSYDGKIHYAVSEDLVDWDYKGEINTEGHSVRHGSVNIIKAVKAEKILQDLYNSTDNTFNSIIEDNKIIPYP